MSILSVDEGDGSEEAEWFKERFHCHRAVSRGSHHRDTRIDTLEFVLSSVSASSQQQTSSCCERRTVSIEQVWLALGVIAVVLISIAAVWRR
jgi:hypothetical protein